MTENISEVILENHKLRERLIEKDGLIEEFKFYYEVLLRMQPIGAEIKLPIKWDKI